jgi:hypothetical protein
MEAHVYRKPFYFIPRTLFYMVDVLGLKPYKAFLYTAVASAWYSGHGLCYSDYNSASTAPDIGVTATDFKEIWKVAPRDGSMNNMLTASNDNNPGFKNVKKKTFSAKHSPMKCWTLYQQGNLKGVVEYLDSVYFPKKAKPKTIRNVTKKAKAKATSRK